jgi:hypothetical protein
MLLEPSLPTLETATSSLDTLQGEIRANSRIRLTLKRVREDPTSSEEEDPPSSLDWNFSAIDPVDQID